MSRLHKTTNNLPLITFCSCVFLLIIVSFTSQGLIYDTACQLKALQQFLNGESPSFNHLVQPAVNDLSRGKPEWIVWWPLGPQLFALPLMYFDLPLGIAVRIIVSMCVILGSLGWIFWIRLFNIPPFLKVLLAVAIPWIRYVSNGFFLYSAETFAYCFIPWLLLAVQKFGRTGFDKSIFKAGSNALLLGFALGAVYIFKYSTVFISIGALIYISLFAFQKKNLHGKRVFLLCGLMGFSFLLPVISLNVLNALLGVSFNSVIQDFKLNLDWEDILFLLANPGLAMADADALWKYFLLHPVHGFTKNQTYVGLVGLPATILIFFLIFRRRTVFQEPARLSRTVFITSLIALFTVWVLSLNAASHEARHIACASFTLLPLILQEGYQWWRVGRSGLRYFLAIMGLIYIVIPLIYGPISVVGKVIRNRNYETGPSHLYNPLLTNKSVPLVQTDLLRDFNSISDIWYLTEPYSWLDLPGRAILRQADFIEMNCLKKDRFLTSQSLRVWVLLPSHFEDNRKGQMIRNSFVQANGWERKIFSACKYDVWTTVLNSPQKEKKFES